MVVNVTYVLLDLAKHVTISSLHAPEPFVVREWFHRQLLYGGRGLGVQNTHYAFIHDLMINVS
jgi:hypothetical protein